VVSTSWVAENSGKTNIRVVEVDVDTKTYDEGHIPNALGWSRNTQLCDTVQRDILSKNQFEALMGGSGIANETTVILYGDNNNWFAAWALWRYPAIPPRC
jgi:thiosulfate/3-mercaptopyruvate sulfurtransferase